MRALLVVVFSFLACSGPALASGGETKLPRQMPWSFEGALGTFDRPSVQRGLQVYREVCAACHGLDRVAFRSLEGVGFGAAEVKALAAEYTVKDGPNDAGDTFDRPGRPSDKFPSPFANEQAARSANGGAYPPDLSLMVKARPDGANYLYSLLTGYADAPGEMHMNEGMSYNPYFSGQQIAMPSPLSAGRVTYQDGTEATVDQMAQDVVHFLQWTAEPEMEQRKGMGVKVMIFLFLTTVLLYLAKRRVWRDLH
jgi:ubiquinol-cytochrome c reductase cytochrome c1 subunit